MAANITPTTEYFSSLMFGDRFRFAGDLQGTVYGPVTQTQDYMGGSFSVDTQDGRHFYGGAFKPIVVVRRAPACVDCGGHVDLCDGCESPWPVELEELWNSLYGGR